MDNEKREELIKIENADLFKKAVDELELTRDERDQLFIDHRVYMYNKYRPSEATIREAKRRG